MATDEDKAPTSISLRVVLLRVDPEGIHPSPEQLVGARVTKATLAPRTLELELHPQMDQKVHAFLQELARDYDHDESAHVHNNGACRVCNALVLLTKLGAGRG